MRCCGVVVVVVGWWGVEKGRIGGWRVWWRDGGKMMDGSECVVVAV